MAERNSQTPLAQYRLGRTALDLQTFTVSDLQGLTGISNNTIYSFLANLDPNYIRSENIAGTGRGRPRKRYSLTRSGTEALIDQNVEVARLLRDKPTPAATRVDRRPSIIAQLPAFMQVPASFSPTPLVAAAATSSVGQRATIDLVDSNAPMVRLQDVTMSYKTEMEPTLRKLRLEVPRGEFVSIFGPAGSGKSTLMSILGLIEQPNSGEYWLGGEPVTHLPNAQRVEVRNRQLGFVLQDLNLIGDRCVQENVEIPLLYIPMASSERQNLVQGALELVGMGHCADYYPRQLTAGQQQRLAVARAMAGRPRFLLVDEPTAHLEPGEGKDILELLRAIHQKGTTICMATQDPEEAKLAQLCYRIGAGQVHREDSISALARSA